MDIDRQDLIYVADALSGEGMKHGIYIGSAKDGPGDRLSSRHRTQSITEVRRRRQQRQSVGRVRLGHNDPQVREEIGPRGTVVARRGRVRDRDVAKPQGFRDTGGKVRGERRGASCVGSSVHAPKPGEDSAEILREAGYADEEIARLASDRVI